MGKMMKRSVMACLAAFLCWGASAQQQVVNIDLQKAIEISLDENPTIKIADLEIERQKYVRRETIGNHLPQLGVAGSYSRAIVKSDMGGGISFDADNTVSAQATLSIPLFAPAIYKTLKLNDEQMRAAVESARGSKITLVNEVKKAYYNILLAQQSLEVLRSSEATVSETVKDLKNKFDAGLAAEYDYITASVQLSNLRPSIIQTQNAIDVAKKMLKMYMGLPLETEVVIEGDLNEYLMANGTSGMAGSGDLTENTDLRSLDIQLDILERTLQVTRTQRMPTLAAFGNFSLSGRDPISFAGMGGGSDSFLWTNPISAGLQISIPIFAGLTNVNKEKQVKNNIAQLQAQRDYAEEGVKLQLNNAYNSVLTAEASMQANKATIDQAQKGYDIGKTRFNAGMGTMLEVNNAELQLTQAKLNYTQAIYDYLSAQADYDMVLGKFE